MHVLRPLRLIAGATLLGTMGCATTQFDRYYAERRWAEAARAFTADSTLANDEGALFRAGLIYSTPGRATYDPVRAHDLLQRLLTRFPASEHRAVASERLAFVEEVLRIQGSAAARERDLGSRIAALTAGMTELRARLDSTVAQSDSTRRTSLRLEAELRDRDEQLRTLRLELQRLKEIDLKPRPPVRRPPDTTSISWIGRTTEGQR